MFCWLCLAKPLPVLWLCSSLSLFRGELADGDRSSEEEGVLSRASDAVAAISLPLATSLSLSTKSAFSPLGERPCLFSSFRNCLRFKNSRSMGCGFHTRMKEEV